MQKQNYRLIDIKPMHPYRLDQRFPTFLGWFPTWRSSNYLFPLPGTTARIPHASRRHEITVFNMLLCIAPVITVKPVIARLDDRLQTSGFGEMRCRLLSGEMNCRFWEVHHSPLQPAYSLLGENPPRLGTPGLVSPKLGWFKVMEIYVVDSKWKVCYKAWYLPKHGLALDFHPGEHFGEHSRIALRKFRKLKISSFCCFPASKTRAVGVICATVPWRL